MAGVKTFSELFGEIKNVVDESMEIDVAEKSKELMKERIWEDVYDAYPNPKDYVRTYELLERAETAYFDDTLYLVNTRFDNDEFTDSLRYVVSVIEMGKNYSWGYGKLDEIIGARPFNKNTHKELKDGRFKEFLSQSLSGKGFKVR